MKKIVSVHNAPEQHWVGNGFPVRSLFSYQNHGEALSPFLLLDFAGPAEFTPSEQPRGVGQHPHRGFETVTIVYEGEVTHRDSTGQGGTIGPGDVQWMTAGAGILHEEFHSPAYSRTGGPFKMIQLWVNLPAKDKMTAPGYQAITKADIPVVELPNGKGEVRVIAGALDGSKGPAHTFTPMNVWDMRLVQGSTSEVTLPEGWHTTLVVLQGAVRVNGDEVVQEAQMVLFAEQGTSITLKASSDAMVLLLSGEPIDEPIVGYGPFVMNTPEEIRQAMADFHSGRFGQIERTS